MVRRLGKALEADYRVFLRTHFRDMRFTPSIPGA
jgi:hypothetical protein